jgi:metallophosphoesterase (TIGR00282 family)
MKILYIAEIVGKAGIYAVKKGLKELQSRYKPDFIIACADGTTGGNGLGRNHAAYLRKLGAQVLTTGECCFYKKDLVENMGKLPYVLRPFNLNPEAPGIGSRIFKTGNGDKIAIAVLLGQSGFSRFHGNNPYSELPVLLERFRQETPFIFIDFHAGATAEKQTFFALAEGRASAVIGSHTRVQTADARILHGTAVITDAGRTGSLESVGGTDIKAKIQEYLSGIPDWTQEAWQKCCLQGVFVVFDNQGQALSIERIQHRVPDMPAPNPSQSGDADGADEE